MRRLAFIIFSSILFCLSLTSNAQQLDSSLRALLDEKLSEYFTVLEPESIQTKKTESDFLIEAATDSLVRQFVALRVYDHYLTSPVMGSEAVAIHIYDKWFQPGLVKMESDMDMLTARIFAEFNRQSQIGELAPELVMETMAGDTVRLFTRRSAYAEDGDRHSVLFFYDAGCARCKVESILLRSLLDSENYPIDFYAVYAGDNRQAWEEYVSRRFDVEAPDTKVVHLWDPSLDSDFQRKYGVVQTPRMFLIRPDGVIKGRGLDASALSQMLSEVFASPDLEYGSPETEEFFDNLMVAFSTSEGGPTPFDVSCAADYLASSSLHAGDTTLCRQMMGDFMYYLAPKTGEGVKEGLDYLIDEYVLGRDDIWKSQDDSLKVIGFAKVMDDLLSKAEPGTVISDIEVPADLLRKGKRPKSGEFRLSRLKGKSNLIVFYTEGCNVCDAEKAAVRSLVASDKNCQALFVNMDRIVMDDPALAGRLFDTFDLSVLPFIVETDRKGKIMHRYVTLQ